MLRHERRLLVDSLLIGVTLTIAVLVMDAAGGLAWAEDILYDLRVRTCQFFNPPPTDKLVHLDIDDPAVEVIGSWPWPRRKMAMIFDELRLAGPKVVELDVLYTEPQEIQEKRLPDGKWEEIDNDADLAAAMARLGNVIVPATLETVPAQSPLFTAAVAELASDLELDQEVLNQRLDAKGFKEHLGERFFVARREAIMQRLAAIKAGPELTFAQVRTKLLPRTPEDVKSGVVNVLREQWDKYLAIQEYTQRLALPAPARLPSLSNMRIHLPPLRQFSAAAAGGAFVDYTKFGSAVIRTLPLLQEQEGRVFPHMGLALAAPMLDADLTKIRIEGDTLAIPRKNAPDVVIPLAPPRRGTSGALYTTLIDIPWFGTSQWEMMYDYPGHKVNKQHIPLNLVWQACEAKRKVITNNHMIDDAIRGLFYAIQEDQGLKEYNALPLSPEDYATREKFVDKLLKDYGAYYLEGISPALKQPFYTDPSSLPLAVYDPRPQKMTYREATLVPSYRSLYKQRKLMPPLVEELRGFRATLASQMKDKAVLVGWTATGAIADFVPTPLHEKSPGVVVHGVIFNGIMTGEMWRRAPWWVAAVTAAVMGMVAAVAVGLLSPVRGLMVAAVLIVGYAVINGVLLFDYGNRIIGAAAPLAAVLVVWSGCTVGSVIIETKHRDHIKARFSNYADPRLVDYVLATENVNFAGENREMTVVFTDLAGFTTLSERLGEKIVPVLNELLGELVPVISEHHQGYINKFLGDGIMFFYNAPFESRDHAPDAVGSVLDMRIKLAEYNTKLREQGLPELAMRAGVVSGHMIVGDAGGGGRSDYTVLGDAVNLSSRLEAANKQVGTNTLINARAQELLNGEFLVRPVGKIRVVGKDEAVLCFEPLAREKDATDEQRQLAAQTTKMVEAFFAGRFEECQSVAQGMDGAKLPGIYRAMCEHYLREGKPADFDGRIVLTEK